MSLSEDELSAIEQQFEQVFQLPPDPSHKSGLIVRGVIANEIGQTVIDGFIHAGLAEGDALFAALQFARELPYERLRKKRAESPSP